MRLRTEIIASEVIFLGGIQQSRVPADCYPMDVDEPLPDGVDGDADLGERTARSSDE